MADESKDATTTVAGDYLRERFGTVWTPDQILGTVADALDAEANGPTQQRASHTGAQKKL